MPCLCLKNNDDPLFPIGHFSHQRIASAHRKHPALLFPHTSIHTALPTHFRMHCISRTLPCALFFPHTSIHTALPTHFHTHCSSHTLPYTLLFPHTSITQLFPHNSITQCSNPLEHKHPLLWVEVPSTQTMADGSFSHHQPLLQMVHV